jgi:hypothetical protein
MEVRWIPPPIPTMRFRGVKTSFRDRGMKIAHINDAAQGISAVVRPEEQIEIRSLSLEVTQDFRAQID